MKTVFLSKSVLMATVLLSGLGAIVVQSCNHSTEVQPIAATSLSSNIISPNEREAIISNNKPQLMNIQRVIALGLLDASVNPEFVAKVNQLVDTNASADADWYTSLTEIYGKYPTLTSAMQSSLLAHGGNNADLKLLNTSLYGFTINGLNFTTGVRLSYKDGSVAVNNVHAIATSQFYSQSAIPTWTYNGSGYEASTAGMHTLLTEQTWTINLLLKNGEESHILNTSPGEPQNLESGRCRTSRRTGLCWSDGEWRRCRCGGYEENPSSL